MGNPVVKGRHFTGKDNADAPRVVIVTESLARRYFPDGNVVGKRLNLNNPKNRYGVKIGVAADVKQFGLNHRRPLHCICIKTRVRRFATLAARTSGDPIRLVGFVRRFGH